MTRALALAAVAFAAALPAQALVTRSGPYELQLLVDGLPARTFHHQGGTIVLGRLGDRYTLRVINRSARRIEAVVSVDGRDVIDGKPADPQKRGYLVPAYGSIDIDGWRVSRQEAAAFRFSTVPESYAARTGNAREVGVIGVAVFPERYYPPPRPHYPLEQPHSWNRGPHGGARGEADGMRAPSAAPESAQAPRAAANGADAPAAAEPSPTPAKRARKSERPGLGTEFGESVSSRVTEVHFVRASHRPSAVLGARYDDQAGLAALGIDVDGPAYSEADLRRTAEPFPVVERGYAEPPLGWRR